MRTYHLCLLGALSICAAACSGGTTASTTVTTVSTTTPTTLGTTTTTTTTTTTMPSTKSTSPLNGTGALDEEDLDRRAIAVKIDNHPKARPQSGIQEADLVYELLVEGGLTRFLAVFHHNDSSHVGPIRSLRPTDPDLVIYLGAPLQVSGGQDWILSQATNKGLTILGDDRVTTFRVSGRNAPHNLYGNTESMRSVADRRDLPNEAPEPIFNFGTPDPSDNSAKKITLDWSDRPEVVWEWDQQAGSYLRFNGDTPHNWRQADGISGQIGVETLLVLTANRYTASPSSGSGTSVPALDTVGSHQAALFYEGSVVEGQWNRDDIESPFSLTLDSGDEMVLPSGSLWIAIFPSSSSLKWQ